jgi:hypothetical protein
MVLVQNGDTFIKVEHTGGDEEFISRNKQIGGIIIPDSGGEKVPSSRYGLYVKITGTSGKSDHFVPDIKGNNKLLKKELKDRLITVTKNMDKSLEHLVLKDTPENNDVAKRKEYEYKTNAIKEDDKIFFKEEAMLNNMQLDTYFDIVKKKIEEKKKPYDVSVKVIFIFRQGVSNLIEKNELIRAEALLELSQSFSKNIVSEEVIKLLNDKKLKPKGKVI